MFTRLSEIDRMFGAMDLLRSRMDRIFSNYDRSSGGDLGWAFGVGSPRTNLYEDGDNFEIRVEIPAVAKEDLNVKTQGNYLEISGTVGSDMPEGYSVHRTERGRSSFTRSYTLPADVDSEKVEAKLENGILYLVLPKAEAVKPKQITIS